MSILSVSTSGGVQSSNLETSRVKTLIPQSISHNAEGFVKLIKSYYDYLNQEGMPSYEIDHIIENHDIDQVSGAYLDRIQYEIAQNVPNSKVIDRVSLYKKITKFYALRGSEDSIYTFFRIFFDEIVSVEYPKDRLFKLSDGDFGGHLNNEPYWNDRKSFISDINRLHDGDFWQEFSYIINTSLSVDQWENEFVRMVHPAGLKFFVAILFILKTENRWIGPNVTFNSDSQKYERDLPQDYVGLYRTRNPKLNLDWMKGLIPNFLKGEFHTPLFQPGWLTGDFRFLEIIIEAIEFANGPNDPSFARTVLMKLILLAESTDTREKFAKPDFLQNLKFLSTTEISYYSNYTIEEALDVNNQKIFNNIGSFIDITFVEYLRINTEDDRNIQAEDDDYLTT